VIVALNVAEAESCEAIWLRKLVLELINEMLKPIVICNDN